MSNKKVWLVTGAGRGMGVDIAKAALAAGDAVVATGRSPQRVRAALGEQDDLSTVALDITNPASAEAAVRAAVERFGRIDVLVNNAGNFYAGFFEETSPEQFRAQIETNLFGPLARALVQLAGQDEPPLRWVAGADAVATAEQKARDLLAQVDAHRELSSSLAHDDAAANA